jgi:proteasome lid subunit RPN8/RPN11
MGTVCIAKDAWEAMLAHARAAYPEECCGVMLGAGEEVRLALPLENTAAMRRTRYEIRPEDLLEATREARERGFGLIGVYHSHPDRDAYFSETDLKNCCPWYLYLVLSIKDGAFDHAACWRPAADRAIICPCEFEWL